MKEDKLGIKVYTGKVARQLLKLGFKIIDVKANPMNKERTLFIFEYKDGINEIVNAIKGIGGS